MAVERSSSGTSLIDVLDRVLDKGIVVDAWVHVSLVGIDLVRVESRVVVDRAPKATKDDGSPKPKKFGSAASSRSAQPTDDEDGDDES